MKYEDLEVGGTYRRWSAEGCDCDNCDEPEGGWEEVQLFGFVPILPTCACVTHPNAPEIFCAVKRLSLGEPRGPMLLVGSSELKEVGDRP